VKVSLVTWCDSHQQQGQLYDDLVNNVN